MPCDYALCVGSALDLTDVETRTMQWNFQGDFPHSFCLRRGRKRRSHGSDRCMLREPPDRCRVSRRVFDLTRKGSRHRSGCGFLRRALSPILGSRNQTFTVQDTRPLLVADQNGPPSSRLKCNMQPFGRSLPLLLFSYCDSSLTFSYLHYVAFGHHFDFRNRHFADEPRILYLRRDA
jgi:hypothetical protein